MWHSVLLKALGDAFAAQGCEVSFVVADPVAARHYLARSPRVFTAPSYRPTREEAERFSARHFGDIMGAAGWHDPNVLAALVNSWDAVIDAVKPDQVVADHAPALRLACRDRVPVVGVGLAFTLPPPHLTHLPALVESAPETHLEHELALNGSLVLEHRGYAPLNRLAQVFESALNAPTCLPELDPYRQWRFDRCIGPVEAVGVPSEVPEDAPWIAYLSADVPETEQVLTQLAWRRPGLAFVRDLSADARQRLVDAGVHLVEHPMPLADALVQAAFIVHHGGAGTMHQAVAVGRPQLLLPRHLEQAYNASVVSRMQAGTVVASAGAAHVETALEQALGAGMRDAAQKWASVASAQIDPGAGARLVSQALAL